MNDLVLLSFGVFAAIIASMALARSRSSLLTVIFTVMPFPLAIFGEGAAGNVSIADLLIAIAGFRLLGRRVRTGSPGQAIIIFLAIATFCSLFSSLPSDLALGIGRMGLLTLVPMLLLANATDPIHELRRGFIAYTLSSAVLALISLLTFLTSGIDASMYTLGINKNGLGSIFGAAVVVSYVGVATRSIRGRSLTLSYAVLGMCSIGLLLSLSRGGWAGTAVGLVLVMICTKRKLPAIMSVILFAPVLSILWSRLPADRIEYATDISSDAYVIRTRLGSMEQALGAFQSNPLFGVGIGLERTVQPHNILILTLGEMGIVGIITFAAMIASGVSTLRRAIRRAPAVSSERAIFIAGAAVFAVYHVQTLIDVYWRRGVGAMSWAAVGAAVAYAATRSPRRSFNHDRSIGSDVRQSRTAGEQASHA